MLKHLGFWLPLWVVLTIIGFLSACKNDKDDTSTPPPKGRLEALLPEGQKSLSISLAAGLTAKPAIIAAHKGGTSTTIHATELTFTSQDPSIAKTMPTGEIIAVAPGVTTIRISHISTGVQALIQVTVTEAVLTSVRVKPEKLTVVAGLGYPLVVEGDLSDGTTVALPATEINWRSSDASVAMVDEQGWVTGTGMGKAVVSATLKPNQRLVATSSVTVDAASIERLDVAPNTLTLEAGLSSQALRATVSLSNGQTISVPPTQLEWHSANNAIAIVEARNAKVTAVAAGNTAIVASLKSDPNQQTLVAVQVNATPIAQLKVTPANVRLPVGLQTTLSASAVLSDGQEIKLAPGTLRWRSSDNSKAIVDELDGRVTGLGVGEVTLSAMLTSDPNQQAHAVLNVSDATIDALTPKASQITLVPLRALEQELRVSARLSNGEMLTLPSAAIQWISSDNQVAVVNDRGTVTGVTTGEVTLTGTLRETVTQGRLAAPVVQVQATVTDEQLQHFILTPEATRLSDGLATWLQVNAVLSSGRTESVPGDKVTWSSNAPKHASIDIHGMVTGHQPGEADITAMLNDYPDHRLSGHITVDDAEVTQLIIAEPSLAMATGLSKPASASAILSNGRTVALPHTLLRWTTSDHTLASVNEQGMVTGLAEGNVILTATLKRDTTKQATVQVTVLPATITQLVVTPLSLHIVDGLTRSLNAHVVLSDGQSVAIGADQISWASSDPTLARVDERGMVTGVAGGNLTLTATLKRDTAKQATVQVTVLPATVDSLEISPPTFKVVAGLTSPLSVQAVLSDGRKLPLMGQEVNWHVDNTAYVRVDEQGMVTGVTEGQVTVTATFKRDITRQVQARGEVLPAMVELLRVSPTPLKVIAGNQLALSAKAIYSDGREADLQAGQLSWHSSDPAVMTVDTNGILRGVQSGNTTLTASLLNDMTKTVSEPVTVLEPTLSAVTIRPQQLTLLRGESAQLALYGQFDNGAELALDKVNWHTSAPEIAIITEHGELHGLAVGSVTITGTVTQCERQWQAQLPVQVTAAKMVLRGSGKSLLFDLPLQPQPLPILEMRRDQDLRQTGNDPINQVPPEQQYTDHFQAVDVRFFKDEHGDLRYHNRSIDTVAGIAVRETGSGQLYELAIMSWIPRTMSWKELSHLDARKYRFRLTPPEGVTLAGLELVDQHGMFRPTFDYHFEEEYCYGGLCTKAANHDFLYDELAHLFRIYNSTIVLTEMETVFGDPNKCRADHPHFSECAAYNDPELPYAHYNFLRMGMEGHAVNLKNAYAPTPTNTQGFAAGAAPDIHQPRATTGGYIAMKTPHTGDGFFKATFHELAHAYGYSHESGMTYGFADHLDSVCSTSSSCGLRQIHGDNGMSVTMPAIMMEHKTVADNRIRIRFLRPQRHTPPQQLKLRLLSGQRHDVRLEMVEGSDTVDLVVENPLSSPLYVRAERDGITYVATIKLTKEDMDPRQRTVQYEDTVPEPVINKYHSPRYLPPTAHTFHD